jgi:hypothetical protein
LKVDTTIEMELLLLPKYEYKRTSVVTRNEFLTFDTLVCVESLTFF